MKNGPVALRVTIRALLLLAGVVLVSALLGRVLLDVLRPLAGQGGHGPHPLTVPEALAAVAAVALLGCWLRAAVAAVLLTMRLVRAAFQGAADTAAWPADRTPRLVRRAVLLALGLGLPAALTVPAQADPVCRPVPQSFSAPAAALAGLRLPDRAVGAARPVRTVTVRTGDSLWSIAAGLLPPGADAATVAATWRGLVQANAAALGPDPDLIFPGDQLVVPVRDRSGKEQP